jgi:DNA-binding transcriptional ArsR family regulator
MWAIAHPIRFRIWELLREGPSTASHLATRLGESRGLMSYHLRYLARAGAIVEDVERGTKRERWWLRPEAPVIVPTPADPEGRAIDSHLLATIFAREEDARSRFVMGAVSDEWREKAFVGNWYVELTPDEADELGRRLYLVVDELRARGRSTLGSEQTLVSLSVLPVLSAAGRRGRPGHA